VTSQVAENETDSIIEGEKTDKMIVSENNDELVVMPVNMTRVNGLCQGQTAVTLVVMCIMWACSNTSNTIVNFNLKYIPGSIYINFTIAGIAEISAHLLAGSIFQKLGVKITFLIGYSLAIAGGVCLVF
jgi:hypothetical protein